MIVNWQVSMEINGVQVRFDRSVALQPTNNHLSVSKAKSPVNEAPKVQISDDGKPTKSEPVKLNASYFYTPGPSDTEEIKKANEEKVIQNLYFELPKKFRFLKEKMLEIERSVTDKVPESAGKYWDFSIDENGLAVVVGQDITTEEQEKIATLINKMGIGHEFVAVRDLMLESVVKERGGDLFSQGIGRFDLTKSNFSKIVYFKESFEDSQYDYFYTSNSLVNQLEARADVVYNKITKVDLLTKQEIDLYV